MDSISNWVVYHFQDTSPFAGVRRPGALNDNETLRPNAENLATFLYHTQATDVETYTRIRDVVRLAAPFFDDFKLRPKPSTPEFIQLEWLQHGSSYPLLASQLSDGTLRFICLAAALLQRRQPRTVLIDEPELGLHPYTLSLLGGLIQKQLLLGGMPPIRSSSLPSLRYCSMSSLLRISLSPIDATGSPPFDGLNRSIFPSGFKTTRSESYGRRISSEDDRGWNRTESHPQWRRPLRDPNPSHR
jgi:hypothetical protein